MWKCDPNRVAMQLYQSIAAVYFWGGAWQILLGPTVNFAKIQNLPKPIFSKDFSTKFFTIHKADDNRLTQLSIVVAMQNKCFSILINNRCLPFKVHF